MKVVVNATPLIALSIIDNLELLQKLFSEVYIAESVYQEVAVTGRNKIGSLELQQATGFKIIPVVLENSIPAILLGLDQGELDTILLAQSIKSDWVIIDEKLGRRTAKALGLPTKGTLGILLAAFYRQYLNKQEIIEKIEVLQNNGIRLSPLLITKVIQELEEQQN